ncbi:MAG TPA: hypothetical protein PK493_13890 [Pseudomonadota bacterium]|nr:hypothetical protein [Pseudomonadota bacterium]
MTTLLGLLYRLPRVLAVPLALLLVALAGCVVALLACSLPVILLCLWARRNVMEWRQRRMLERALLASGLAELRAQQAGPDANRAIPSR